MAESTSSQSLFDRVMGEVRAARPESAGTPAPDAAATTTASGTSEGGKSPQGASSARASQRPSARPARVQSRPAAASVTARPSKMGRIVYGALIAVGAWTVLHGPAAALKEHIEQAYAPRVTMNYVNVQQPGSGR